MPRPTDHPHDVLSTLEGPGLTGLGKCYQHSEQKPPQWSSTAISTDLSPGTGSPRLGLLKGAFEGPIFSGLKYLLSSGYTG
jgi:hypothetical protein